MHKSNDYRLSHGVCKTWPIKKSYEEQFKKKFHTFLSKLSACKLCKLCLCIILRKWRKSTFAQFAHLLLHQNWRVKFLLRKVLKCANSAREFYNSTRKHTTKPFSAHEMCSKSKLIIFKIVEFK